MDDSETPPETLSEAPPEAPSEAPSEAPVLSSIAGTVDSVLAGEAQAPLETSAPEPLEPEGEIAKPAPEPSAGESGWRAAAEEAKAFSDHLIERGLNGEDLRLGVDLVASIKGGDPVKALAMLQPLYEQLQTRAGQTLPPDLAEAVQNGWVTEEYAQRLAERLGRAQDAEERRARAHRQRERAEAERQQASMLEAATNWEKTIASRDPEFKNRADLVQDVLYRLVRETPPSSPGDLIALLDAADRRVRGKFPKPPRPPTPSTPNPGRAASHRAGPRTIASNIDEILSGAA